VFALAHECFATQTHLMLLLTEGLKAPFGS
jgi:hypothetical protein